MQQSGISEADTEVEEDVVVAEPESESETEAEDETGSRDEASDILILRFSALYGEPSAEILLSFSTFLTFSVASFTSLGLFIPLSDSGISKEGNSAFISPSYGAINSINLLILPVF